MKTLLFIQAAQGAGMMAYLPFILILAIMYFLMIRPQAKRQKEKQAMNLSYKEPACFARQMRGLPEGDHTNWQAENLIPIIKNDSRQTAFIGVQVNVQARGWS